MARRGRPPSRRAASALGVYIRLRLYPGEDDDLIAFFSGIPSGLRAVTVKRALRSGIETSDGAVDGEDDALLDALDAFVN